MFFSDEFYPIIFSVIHLHTCQSFCFTRESQIHPQKGFSVLNPISPLWEGAEAPVGQDVFGVKVFF